MKEWVLTPDRFLSKEEIGKLLKRAEELRSLGVAKSRKQPVRDWLIIRLALLSGLRASEVAALRVTDCFIVVVRSLSHLASTKPLFESEGCDQKRRKGGPTTSGLRGRRMVFAGWLRARMPLRPMGGRDRNPWKPPVLIKRNQRKRS